VKAYVASLLTVVEESKFHEGDLGELPLNPEASSFNGGTVLRPAILDERTRDPGPISLQRYLHQRTGIPTFANAPVAVRKEDLVAGNIEVAFVGVPLDMSSGYRDAKHAPTTLRITDGLVGSDVDAQIDPTLVLRIADYGNLSVDNMSIERTIGHVRFMIADMVSAGVVPFIVGGDRALTYPDVAGVVDTLGKGKVAMVSFSPHPDAIADFDHELVDANAVGRVLSEGLVDGKNLVQIGLRGPQAKAADLQRLSAQGVRYHTMAEVERSGWEEVMSKALKEMTGGAEGVFVSFDMSVLDPGDAPGVGRPVPGGLTMREAAPLVRRLCAETKIVGFEMLDVAPIMDPTYKTAMNANRIMNACLTGIAMRKEGLTKPGYLNPVSLGAKR
jgi:agmatinase